jgi:branched-chain amino acid transport system substrate-binding protein
VDLLIGPYSSGLTLAVAPLAEAHGKILWNHGGASDAIFQGGWRHLVSVPSPASDYLKALPLLVRTQDPSVARISVVYAKTGSFALHVARGVADGAKAAGFDVIGLVLRLADPGRPRIAPGGPRSRTRSPRRGRKLSR